MALRLAFKNVPNDVDVSIKPEDIEHARSIGILTPREVVSSDFVPAKVHEPEKPTWASKASGKSCQDAHDSEYLALVHEAEFLSFMDAHQTFLDDLDEMWDEASLYPFIMHPREIPCTSFTTEVRVIAIKQGYYQGSIGARGTVLNVYIKTQMALEPHSLYLMDVIADAYGSFPWRATKVYPKLNTADMLVSNTFSEIPDEDFMCTWKSIDMQYRLPTPAIHIGAMIGRQGKNISALISWVNQWDSSPSYGEPEITIVPTDDFKGCIVTFHQPEECAWTLSDIEWLISHFHC